MTMLDPLHPELVPQVFERYARAPWGWDLLDPQDVALSLAQFDQLLWRGPSAQFASFSADGDADLVVRLVDVDFRHRSARLECWELEATLSDGQVAAGIDLVLEHAASVLGLHRVSYRLPGFLVPFQRPLVSERFALEGRLVDRLQRRGRLWDVELRAVLVDGPS